MTAPSPTAGSGAQALVETEIAICTVTHNDGQELEGFVSALEELEGPPSPLVVVDCASTDDSAPQIRALATHRPWITCHALTENVGFAGGMNQAIALARSFRPRWIWSLNADTRPAPDAARALLKAARCTPRDGAVGAVTPRLHRLGAATPLLDACGIRLTRTWRHLDRGSEEPDDSRYLTREEVFGGTGAATLYRLEALDAVAFRGGDLFDSLFHSYREDAELAFRLQRSRWRTIYEPSARVAHRRRVTPERRSQLPASINRTALKNRYLLRLYHQSLRNALGIGVAAWARDLGILGYVLLRERSSLGAYRWLWQHRAQLRQRRRELSRRNRAGVLELDFWFRHEARALAD